MSDAGGGPPDLAVFVPCMAAAGLAVNTDGTWSDPSPGRRSSADRAAQQAAALDCLARAAGGR